LECDYLGYFFRAASKYQQKHKKVPVLIIDNSNKIAHNQPEILDMFQDYARLAADERLATFNCIRFRRGPSAASNMMHGEARSVTCFLPSSIQASIADPVWVQGKGYPPQDLETPVRPAAFPQ
jgi:hypothetical protein